MPARSPQRREARAFTAPEQVNHRRYEALRAFFVDGLSYAEAGQRFGYTRWGMVNLVREYRAGKLELFAPPRKPGPTPGSAPAKERVRARVIELRREGLSTYEISARLATEGTPLNRTSVGEILTEEGFGRLLRHPEPVASTSPATPGRDTRLPRTARLDFQTWPATVETGKAGLLLCMGDLVALDLPAIVKTAGYPGTSVIPALSSILSLLALKLANIRRTSHVEDLATDPGAALFAGLSSLPKTTALTSYSYKLSHERQHAFLQALNSAMLHEGLIDGSDFDLDFHAIMHWGEDAALEKHYVPSRSQRTRSVLTFFAQDASTHNLIYANADISKATQAREVIAFCEHWRSLTGHDPGLLVFDQKLTTQAVLQELDERGVTFMTLRMRSPALIRHIDQLHPAAFKTVRLDRDGNYRKPEVVDETVRLSDYPHPIRQLVVRGLGRESPTVLITNHNTATPKYLIERYARRMTIEQRLAEAIRSFHLDSLSSAVPLNVDLDVALSVLASAICSALRQRLPGYHTATPDTLQRRFLQTSGLIHTTNDTITVRLDRRAYSPVLRAANLPDTTVPWWENRTLRYEFS